MGHYSGEQEIKDTEMLDGKRLWNTGKEGTSELGNKLWDTELGNKVLETTLSLENGVF